jgi:hypothetical protein
MAMAAEAGHDYAATVANDNELHWDLKVKALKNGKMTSGEIFCLENKTYRACRHEMRWYVETESIDGRFHPHGMSEDFLNEYFKFVD